MIQPISGALSAQCIPVSTHPTPTLPRLCAFGLQLSPLLPPANEILFHPKFLAQKSPALGYFQTPKQTTALPLPVLLCLLPCESPGWTGRSRAAGQNLVYSPMNVSLLSLLLLKDSSNCHGFQCCLMSSPHPTASVQRAHTAGLNKRWPYG